MVLAAFADFMQQVVSGLASGGIYALLALALVIIHRSTGVINFAQGEMATLSTYIAWTLTVNHGWSYWPAFVATLAISFAGGVGIHRVVIRPVERGNVLRIVIVTIGLLVAINGFVDLEVGRRAAAAAEPVRDEHVRRRRRHRRRERHRDDRRRARDRRPPLAALPVHEGRARAARGGGESGGGEARRRARHLDARARLGPRGAPRRGRRDADRARPSASIRT